MADVLQKPARPYEPRGRLDPDGFAQRIRFRAFRPPPSLAPFVEHGWVVAWDQQEAYLSPELMHRPYVDIFVSATGGGIQGTFRGKRTYEAAGRGRIVGVRFRPAGFHAFWSGEMAELQDRVFGLPALFPRFDETAATEILERDDEGATGMLFRRLEALRPEPEPAIEQVNRIIAAIEADDALGTVHAVSECVGRSERWLQQLFREYVGVGLKWFLQRRKLLAAAERVRSEREPNWAALAYDLGYSSQQHFITDFRKVLGSTPLQYRRSFEHMDR